MSYSYMFFRPLRDGPMSSWPAEWPPPLGTEAEVKARIGEVFPGIEWHPPESMGVWEDGDRCAQFTLAQQEDGMIRSVGMSHCAREEVERLARHLGPGVIAMDEQTAAVYSIADGSWRRPD